MGERLACVDVPALPLQLLARRHREWAGRPIAVVDRDRPTGTILWVNEKARRSRVLPGLKYAAGLSLCRDLCAGEVPVAEIRKGVERLSKRLGGFSPDVEPCRHEPGVFWLNAAGLGRLHPSLQEWAQCIRDALAREGFASRVAVGASRFGTYAVARAAPGVSVFEDPVREYRAALCVRLDRLHVEPELRETLAKLGVHTVGDFVGLPPGGLEQRFGKNALWLHRLAAGEVRTPLDPVPQVEPVQVRVDLEHPETDSTRLLFLVKRRLDPLLRQLDERREVMAELFLHFQLDGGERRIESVRPAAATLDAAQILELVHLRLEAARLPAGAVELRIVLRGVPADPEQLALFARHPKRDLDAAGRAFARIRTEFGRHAVVWAQLREGHLPEAGFTWEPLENAKLPHPREVGERPLVRRLRRRPLMLPSRARHEPDGWMVRGLEQGPVILRRGPYLVSGGWWAREVRREYHFLETQRGDLLWVYYDRRRRRWFLHGEVL